MKMSLVKSLLLFVCLLFIYMFVVNATCWIDCSVESYRPLEPYCYLNDDRNSYYCSIDVTTSQLNGLTDNNWNKVRLAINVTNTVTQVRLDSRLEDYKLEVNAFRVFPQVTKLEINYRKCIVLYSTFSLLTNLKHLYMYDVAFHQFPAISLVNPHLTYLVIYNYRILSGTRELKSHHVSGLSKLKYLFLYPIDRTTVTHRTFSGLTALTALKIDSMRPEPNPVSILSSLRRLKVLGISQCELTSIEFLKQTPWLYQLTHLNFWNNIISSFSDEVFTDYTELKDLGLQSNRISVINRSNFTQLGSLNVLSLHTNEITSIPSDTFKDMPLLTRVYLYHNPLTTLSSRVFEHLTGIRYIYLYNNRFHCDCTLQWMSVVEQEYGIYLYSPSCQTPTEYRGRVATDPALYTNCTRDLSYDCFSRSVKCPRGSFCEDTIDSYLCVCEGEGVAFSSSLNRCVNYERLILASQGRFLTDTNGHATFVPHTAPTCPTIQTTVPQSCPVNNCPRCPTIQTPVPPNCPICPTTPIQSCPVNTCPICPTTTQSNPLNTCPICPTTATPDPTKSAGS